MFTSIQWGGAVGVLVVAFAFGYRLGGESSRDQLDRFKTQTTTANAAQLSKVVTVLEAQKVQASDQLARQRGVLDEYEKERAAALDASVGQRMLNFAARTACPRGAAVPGAATATIGTVDPATSAASVERFNGLLNAVGRAIESDAARQRALIALAPQ